MKKNENTELIIEVSFCAYQIIKFLAVFLNFLFNSFLL